MRVEDVAFANGLWGGIMVRGDPSIECGRDVCIMPERYWVTSSEIRGRGGLDDLAETTGNDVPAAAVGNVGFLR
jgi:hypothetical protein